MSNGALYAHFGSKAELLVAALRKHGRRLLADLFAADPGRPITDCCCSPAGGCPGRDARGHLIVEALVAARRDEDVAAADARLRGRARSTGSPSWCGAAQASGELDPALSPGALAHFCLLLSMGSALVTPDLHAVADEEWAALLARVIAASPRPPLPPPQTGAAQ